MLVEISKMKKQEVAVVSSLDVAETFGKRHDSVLRDIRNLDCSDDFRLHNFGESSYLNEQNHKQPMYLMTRDGFTFLAMGYTGEKAAQFKEAYIKQFNAMETALRSKLIEREKGIAVRQSLTKALQMSAENERMHGHAYSNYTNCIYKALFGVNASQLRVSMGVDPKDNLRDFLSEENLRAVESMERLVSGLVDCGMGYDEVKEFIGKYNTKKMLEAV